MYNNKEIELKEAISGLCERLGVKGHLFLYLAEGDKVKIMGDISFSALAPMLMSYLAKKIV